MRPLDIVRPAGPLAGSNESAQPPVRVGRTTRLGEAVLCVAAVAVGLWTMPLALLGTDLARVPGGIQDGRFNNYVFEHGYRYLTGGDPSFWTAPIFYPVPQTTALSDSHIGTLPVYAACRLAGADRETAYQLWWVSCFVVNYLVCYPVLRGFGLRPFAATAGAYLFTFGMGVLVAVWYNQLTPRAGVPLAFYFTWRFLNTGRTRHLLGAGLAVVWQMYATIYIGYFLMLATVGYLAVGLVAYRREVWANRGGWRDLRNRAAVVVGCAALAWPLVSAHRSVANPDIYQSNLKEIAGSLPPLQTWFAVNNQSLLWSWLDRSIAAHPAPLFFGGLAVLGALAAIVPGRRSDWTRLGLMALASWAGCVLLTANLGDYSPYWLLAKLPGVAAVRAVYRISVVALFPAALLVGLLLSRVEAGFGRWPGLAALIGMAGVALMVVDQSANYSNRDYEFDKRTHQERVARMADRIRQTDPGATSAVCVFPLNPGFPELYRRIDMMMASQSLGIPTPNGYSGHTPPGLPAFDQVGVVQQWKILAEERYGWLRRGQIKYFAEYKFHRTVVIDQDNEGQVLGPYSRATGPFPPADRSVRFALERVSNPWTADRMVTIKLAVTNPTQRYWPAAGVPVTPNTTDKFEAYGLFLTHRWTHPDGREARGWAPDWAGIFPQDVPAGVTVPMKLIVTTPKEPGDYVLEVTAGQSHVGYFGHGKPDAVLRVPVRVGPGVPPAEGPPAFE